MWRKYNQNSKKRSGLDSPEHGESRKVPLTPAERAKAYRERKRLRGLDQPSNSTGALRNPDDETPVECSGSEATTPMECSGREATTPMECFGREATTPLECTGSEATTPMECTGSETDVVMLDSQEISVVQPREGFDTRWSGSNRYFDEAFLTKALVILAMCAIDFGLEKT
jgi:hypothetical protein